MNEITFKISSLKKTGHITPTSPGTDWTRLSTTAHLRQARTSPRPWRHRTIPHGEVRSMRGTFQAHGITSLDRMASMLSVGSTHPDPGWRVDSWWKAGASWKKVELIFPPKEPNPHDPVLFLILVSGTEKEEPARYWIIHVGVINLTSLSRFAGTVPLSKVGDIEYLIYTSKQVLCSQTAGWTMLVSGRRFALLELQLDTNNEMRSCYV